VDRFDTIAAFVAVADRKGFAAAARALGLSPSAVTRLVAALEARLGVRLLQRTTRSVRLTDAGARFLERARIVLADLADAERLAENERATPTGRLRITAPLMFGRLHVGPLVGRYMTAYPEVTVELQLADRVVNLIEEGIDIAVRIGALADSSDVARRVGATRRVLVGAPGYLKARGGPRHPEDLAAHRLISCTGLTAARRWRFEDRGKACEIDVAPAYVTNSTDAAIWHAAHGGGLTLALSYQVAGQVKAKTLRIVLADYEPPPLPIQFVYSTSRLLSVKVRALIDLAVATCDWSFVEL
jgi:DNA-binding transcriptional LysR family regulator